MDDKFKVGEKVVLSSGNIDTIVGVDHIEMFDNRPLYWLSNGLHAYEFELIKYQDNNYESDKPVVLSPRDLPRGFEGDYLLEKGNGREAWIRCGCHDYKERG